MQPELVQRLVALRNKDGGWGYGRAAYSWTEPTAYALLALRASGLENSPAYKSGVTWLPAVHGADGGWRPSPQISESTWVTSLVLLVPDAVAAESRSRGLAWLMEQSGRDTSWAHRMRTFILGHDSADSAPGWPFYPQTSGWVVPTAVAILALTSANTLRPDEDVRRRAEAGRRFLRARQCSDGGWNHGSNRALGYEAPSYPETTGLALAALAGSDPGWMGRAADLGARMLADCRSLEGAAWLTIGLSRCGRRVSGALPPAMDDARELSLSILASHAAAGGKVLAT